MNPRVVLVTGGTRGIGLATAAAFAAAGDLVHVCSRGGGSAGLPPGVRVHGCDVGDGAAVEGLFAAVGSLDVLVNNAGIAGSDSLEPGAGDEVWHAILATNLTGTYLCSKAALPLLPDGAGRIVNVSSVLGLRGGADQIAYSAAKHGVIGLTRALAHALAPRGITVNAVCPGWVDTPMAAARFAESGRTREQAAAGSPLGRIATPEDVAGAILYLASPAARHVTGAALPVDGGVTA